MTLMRDRANVYGADNTGRYTLLLKENLKCAVEHISGGTTANDRQDMLRIRRFRFDARYFMPDYDVQIEVHGKRWNIQSGTLASVPGPFGGNFERACDIVEVK